MKSNILLLSLLTLIANVSIAKDARLSQATTRVCCKKQTCAPTIISAPGIIDESGAYCLSRNIVGTIEITASDVTFDLNSHEIDADGNPFAITIVDLQNVKVFNGSISNSSDAGILVDPSAGIELSNLFMQGHQVDAIRVEDSIDITIHNVNVLGNFGGERALYFDTCKNIHVSGSNASGFLSTIGAVVQFDTCVNATVQNVSLVDNIKTSAADVNEFTAGTAFVSVNNSTGVSFESVKVNGNVFSNTVPVTDPTSHWRTAEAIMFINCIDCSLHQCETSNNIDSAGASSTLDTEDFFLLLKFCQSCVVSEHQSVRNNCTAPITYFILLAALDSSNVTIDGCHASNSTVSELTVLPNADSQFYGIWVANYNSRASTRDNIVRNCQVSTNTVTRGGSGRTSITNSGLLFGITLGNEDNIIDNCQVSHNRMVDAQQYTAVIGIFSDAATNSTITRTATDFNTGAERATGICMFFGATGIRGFNALIADCSSNLNGNDGVIIGYPGLIATNVSNVVIKASNFNKNGSQAGTANGIFIAPVSIVSRNILIQNCQIYETGSAASTSANGIQSLLGNNVVIEDTNVFNTTSNTTGYGIHFDSMSNSKVIRSQVHGNKNSGVRVDGLTNNVALIESIAINNEVGFDFADSSTANCCLVQDCRAIDNSTFGFYHGPETLSTSFIGNEAQCNGVQAGNNFVITGTDNQISLYELAWDTGLMTHVSGQPTISRWTNVQAVPSSN